MSGIFVRYICTVYLYEILEFDILQILKTYARSYWAQLLHINIVTINGYFKVQSNFGQGSFT